MGERLLRVALEHAAGSVQMSGIGDPTESALARIGGALPAVLRAASVEQVGQSCDCLYIASPSASHLDHAQRALAARRTMLATSPTQPRYPGCGASQRHPRRSSCAGDPPRRLRPSGSTPPPEPPATRRQTPAPAPHRPPARKRCCRAALSGVIAGAGAIVVPTAPVSIVKRLPHMATKVAFPSSTSVH